jgi:hypothetical protein
MAGERIACSSSRQAKDPLSGRVKWCTGIITPLQTGGQVARQSFCIRQRPPLEAEQVQTRSMS